MTTRILCALGFILSAAIGFISASAGSCGDRCGLLGVLSLTGHSGGALDCRIIWPSGSPQPLPELRSPRNTAHRNGDGFALADEYDEPFAVTPSFHEVNDAHSQLTRIRSMYWPALRRINALDSLLRGLLGIPIHSSRDAL